MATDGEQKSKVFNDPIHGSVELPELLIKMIDTPQFQRLRYIKQLGGAYFVYPGASHNRFEHSIGVAHLAGELAKSLQTRQPELEISDGDILCVQIAGLCHDLGHGPFSHLFDQMFIPNAERPPGALGQRMENWTHEEASIDMFDHMVKSNGLEVEMKKNRLKLPMDTDFIKEMIAGLPKRTQGQKWPGKGREEDKSFLYEIVANEYNKIDVDKFDYFARDSYHLGIKDSFDHNRFIKFARVCEVNGQKHICTREKEVGNLYEMFHTRHCLHRRAYQNKVNIIIQHMIAEAFLKADEHIQIEGSGGKMFTLSTAIFDMKAYTKLTDHVFEQILHSTDQNPELKEAREILENITRRRLYKSLGQTQADEEMKVTQLKDMIPRWKEELALPVEDGLTPEDFEVVVITMDYGMKDKNPIDKMRFYNKRNPNEAFEIPESKKSKLFPKCFSETLIRVYCRKIDDESMEAARVHFNNWEQNVWPQPQGVRRPSDTGPVAKERRFTEPHSADQGCSSKDVQAARDTVTPELTPGENVENDLSN